MADSYDCAVIGGGLAGLSAALTLQKKGADVVLLEASNRVGGRVATDEISGFLCDRGFQLINSKYPSLVALDVVREIEFIPAPRIIEVGVGNRRHVIGDPRAVPLSVFDSATGTIPEKINLLRLIFTKPAKDASLGQLLEVVGRTYERTLRPFLEGVFLTDPHEVDATYGISTIRSFINGSPGLPRLGVGQLPMALAKRVHNLKLHTRVERFSHSLIETSQGDFFAKKIIIATDAATATQLLDIGDGTSMAGCITWYHTSEINPSGTGHLIVDGQRRGPVINSVVISDISPSYAPPGTHLISTTTPLNTTESEVRRHLALLWLSDTRDWPLIAKYEIPSALPLHYVGKPLSQPLKISEQIFIAGDHRAVPSQQGALFTGKLAAELAFH